MTIRAELSLTSAPDIEPAEFDLRLLSDAGPEIEEFLCGTGWEVQSFTLAFLIAAIS